MNALDILMPKDAAQGVARPAQHLTYHDFRRSVVLFCSFRCGSHMFKAALERLTGLSVPPEPLNRYYGGEQGYTIGKFAAEAKSTLPPLSKPRDAAHAFLVRFFAAQPPEARVLLDIKYQQAYALGVTDETLVPMPTPMLLDVMHRGRVPFVHMIRRDVVSQAISLMIAEKSGSYFATPPLPNQNEPTPAKIRLVPRQVFDVARNQRLAQLQATALLKSMDVQLMTIAYEDLIGPNRAEHYREAMRFMNLYGDIPPNFSSQTISQNSMALVANMAEIRAFVASQDEALLS